MEIIGRVTKVGKVKDYLQETNFGKSWQSIFKFFIELESEERGIILTMVECKAEQTQYGYKIPKNEERQKPLVGDTVKITTHRLRENGNNDKWASVTWNQSFDIIKENKQARKERDAWIADKKAEREAEFKKKGDEMKQDALDRKLETLGHLETQKHDDRLPEVAQAEITGLFNVEKLISLLRDTTWFKPLPEGEGGKQCYHNPPCGCGYPGTGMRRPGGCLYGLPKNQRGSILKKALKTGLIEMTNDEDYRTTDLGVELLFKLDRCIDNGEFNELYHSKSYYSLPTGTTLKSSQWIWICQEEYKKFMNKPHGGGSNTQTIYKKGGVPKRLKTLMEG